MITELNNIYREPASRFGFCQNVANRYGDFKIMKSWFIDGSPRFAKWRSVVECSHHDDNYKDEFSQRFMADGVLDEVYLFETGSKGIHIHIFLINEYLETMPDKKAWLKKMAETKKLLSYWGFDTQKQSTNVPIALEFAPHWKSGKQKRLINGRGEFYGQNRILK
jgi:hypothetical protein